MRRQLYIVATVFMILGSVAVVADEAVLMDFTQLTATILEDPVAKGTFTQNKATMMDFASVAGASYTDDQKKQMRTSLAINNWDVVLASSSRSNENQSLSYTKEAVVAKDAKQFAGKTVMGVRVHFPTEPFNSWARIVPPFTVPAFEPKADVDDQGAITPKKDAGTDPQNARLTRFEGVYDANTKLTTALGIVKNVGVVKAVAVSVKGLNFPHGLYVLLSDTDNAQRQMFMGYLNFDGWRELRWDNPQYISDVRNRELRVFPLYPKSSPFVKLDGFQFTRDAATVGGDFVAYIKDVKVLYDKAILEPITDIDDEAIWGIVGKKEDDRKKIESKRFGSNQVLRYIEKMKQESKTEFTNTEAKK